MKLVMTIGEIQKKEELGHCERKNEDKS